MAELANCRLCGCHPIRAKIYGVDIALHPETDCPLNGSKRMAYEAWNKLMGQGEAVAWQRAAIEAQERVAICEHEIEELSEKLEAFKNDDVAPDFWITPASLRARIIATDGERAEVSAYREPAHGFTVPLYTQAPAVDDAVVRDAARYRWLRSKNVGPSQIEKVSDDYSPPYFTLKCENELDAAIDAAMKRED